MTGGIVTLIATMAIIALSISETVTYLSSNIHEQLYVDSTSSDLCVEVNQNKTAYNEDAAPTTPKCGSCYGARENFCCNTCDDVREAYQAKGLQVNLDEVEQCKSNRWVKLYADHKSEGCRVYGKVAKVSTTSAISNFKLYFAESRPYHIVS